MITRTLTIKAPCQAFSAYLALRAYFLSLLLPLWAL